MSIVAWDGKTLAADCQGTEADARHRINKIKRLEDGTILAFVGQQDTGLILFRWYESGANLQEWPTSQHEEKDCSHLIVVAPSGEVRTFAQYAAAQPLLEPFWAWGSGRDYALGAMAAGMKAREAVEIACQFCTTCGMGVEAFDMRPLELIRTGD